ncbi:hypothetical protein BDZ94DRAFT_1292380 [Collybia nuda]|uniref:Uncharacterized protein n=1 Tax=Collybia nuda TaxID=64659 RepID=A0A9P6C9S8_9AGAR|nr:hypothetical protein BDZ94DRAFT_1292380 [Collybia nuda]
MKASLLLALIAPLMPTLTMGLIGINWNMTNIPPAGLPDITFPFSLIDTPHEVGYYFAQSINFKNVAGVGYTGLQPRPDVDGKPMIHAKLFSYVPDSTSTDSNCTDGNPDGGEGVSCAVDFSGSYGPYAIEVRNANGTTWEGTVVDLDTNRRVHVGSFTLPEGTGGITGSQVGYVEYYPWNTGVHKCADLPDTTGAFGVPQTTVAKAVGILSDAYEYGECVGEVGFLNTRTEKEVKINVGFK